MFKAIISFFVKAAPRFVGEMMKNPKNVTSVFKQAGEKLSKSGLAKKTEDFLGQKPGAFMKECARSAVQQSATSLMMTAMVGGVSKLFSGGGGKQYSFPQKTSGTVVTGGGKAPGVQNTNAAQYGNVKAFNQTSRALGIESKRQDRLRKQQKKVIDRYRKNIQKKDFSIAEVASLSNRLEKELQQQKPSLTSGLKSGKYTADGLKTVQPAKKIKQPTQIPQEQQQLAAYTKEAIEDMNNQMQENIKAVNENISKSIATMNKKEEEIAQRMMSNLGNYNTVTYKKLADTVTKTEEVSFKKQQEASYYQTDVLADKLDSSHDYNSKQMDVLRGEVLGNTQTMYELDKQNRMIDENYRALEERKNNGFTLATLGALLTQTYKMVNASLKTPDIINDNVNNAMKSVAYTAGEEVGKLIQLMAEMFNGIRAFWRQVYKKVANWAVIGPIVGAMANGLDWINDRIFRGLLGVEDSVVGDVFGVPGTLTDIKEDAKEEAEERKYGNDYGDNTKVSKRVSNTSYAGALYSTKGKDSYGLAANHMADLFDTNWEVKGNKVNVTTNSGYSTTLKHDKRDDESDEEYKTRKLEEAIEKETTEGFIFTGDNLPSRDNEQQARERLRLAIAEVESAIVKRSGQQGSGYLLDYTYDTSHATLKPSYTHSEPPAVSKNKGSDVNKNCVETITDTKFVQAWASGTKSSLKLAGGLKMRLLKAFKQASAKGIRYRVTSVFRVPSIGYKYLSPHHLGIAVDVSIDGIADAIMRSWDRPSNVYPHKTYWSVLLTSDDLEGLINRSQLKEGASETDYDLFVQWGEWQKICSQNELSVGVFKYSYAASDRGIENGTKRLDMVHIQVADTAQAVSQEAQKDKEKMSKESMSDINAAASDKISKGLGLDYQLTSADFERDFFGDMGGVKQEEEKTLGWVGPKRTKNFNYYYTDNEGKVMYDSAYNKASVMDYKKDEEGKLVLRKKDEHEKKMKTGTGMLLLDKIRANELSDEDMQKLKQEIARWEGLDEKAQKASDRRDEMRDIIYITNNFDNTTVTSNPNEISTGNESNIPQ